MTTAPGGYAPIARLNRVHHAGGRFSQRSDAAVGDGLVRVYGLNRPVRVYTNRLATEPWDITSYEYDLPLDQPTRVDLAGETEPVHVYEYNSRGLKTQEEPGRPEEIRWTYDAAGRVKRVEYPSDTRVDSTYTGDGVSSVTTASLLENGTLQKVEVRKNLRGWVTSEAGRSTEYATKSATRMTTPEIARA